VTTSSQSAGSTGRSVARGAAWLYGATIATAVLQFGYAAITSRIVGADGFGAYAVALSAGALVALIGTAGIPGAVGRMVSLDKTKLRALSVAAVWLGLASGLVLVLTAPLWAALWRTPEAAPAIRATAVGAACAPLLGLLTALTRRLGRFRWLAGATVGSSAVGMVVGVLVVLRSRNAESLVFASVASQLLLTVALYSAARMEFEGRWRAKSALSELSYSAKLTGSRMVAYLSGNVGRWSVTTSLGAAAFGQWNRAEAVSTVPFHQLQSAMMQATYPEFRHDREGPERAFRIWADVVAMVAWVAVPLACVGAVIVPLLVPALFGPGWETAARMVPVLMIAGGIQCVVMILSSALEALGVFKWLWLAQCAALTVQIAGAIGVAVTHSIVPVFIALPLSLVVFHAVDVVAGSRLGYLSWRRLARHYVAIATASILIALVTWVSVLAFRTGWPGAVAAVVCLAGVALYVWRKRESLPPIRLAREYGLLGARS